MHAAFLQARAACRRTVSTAALHRGHSGTIGGLIRLSPQVEAALAQNRPVVALESTIISHGMPYPQNVALARDVEKVVSDGGAVPATIAIIDGQILVGLDAEALERLGKGGSSVRKCSTRDLASVVAQAGTGATTVAATMKIAHTVGIHTFVTGGVGGVHRGAESTLDISADLVELGRTPVAVVCAGIKSILDIAKTLEYLETQGVPVITLATQHAARTSMSNNNSNANNSGSGSGIVDFPAFFSPTSGIPSPEAITSEALIAKIIHTAHLLGLTHGHVIAVPNPSPAEGAEVERAIQQALSEANSQHVAGRDVTPFILKRVNELTGGKSLAANIALVKNNAAVGARIAVEISRLRYEAALGRFSSQHAVPDAVSGGSRVGMHTAPSGTPSADSTTSASSVHHATGAAPVHSTAMPAAIEPAPSASEATRSRTVSGTASSPVSAMRASPVAPPVYGGGWDAAVHRWRQHGAATASTAATATNNNSTSSRSSVGGSKGAVVEHPHHDVLPAAPPSFTPTLAGSQSPSTSQLPPAGGNDTHKDGLAGRVFKRKLHSSAHATRVVAAAGAFATVTRATVASAAPSSRESVARAHTVTTAAGASATASPAAAAVGASASVARRPLVIGGSVLDLLCRPAKGSKLLMATSNPGTITQSFGGVGRNIAEAMSRMGSPPLFVTAVGADAGGTGLLSYCTDTLGMRVFTPAPTNTTATNNTTTNNSSDGGARTAVYSALLDEKGELVAAIADMAVFDTLTPTSLDTLREAGVTGSSSACNSTTSSTRTYSSNNSRGEPESYGYDEPAAASTSPSSPALTSWQQLLSHTSIVLVDANIAPATTRHVLVTAAACTPPIPVVFEATSIAKCSRILDSGAVQLAAAIKPNRYEVLELARKIRQAVGLAALDAPEGVEVDTGIDTDSAQGVSQASKSGAHRGGSSGEDTELDTTTLTQSVNIKETSPAADTQASSGSGSGGGSGSGSGSGSSASASVSAAAWQALASALGAQPGSNAQQPSLQARDSVSGRSLDVTQSDLTEATTSDSHDAARGSTAGGGAGGDASSALGQGEGEKSESEEEEGLDYAIATAAQTVLAALVRPGGLGEPLGALAASFVVEQHGANALTQPPPSSSSSPSSFHGAASGSVATAHTSGSSAPSGTTSTTGSTFTSHQQPMASGFPGGLLEGRKHVFVTLGKAGVFWVSAPPASSPQAADLLLVLPFFAAAQHPEIGMDFKLCPAPQASMVKCTGAGDTLIGATLAHLVSQAAAASQVSVASQAIAVSQAVAVPQDTAHFSSTPGSVSHASVAHALRVGLAAAKIAVESEAGVSTIPSRLTPALARTQAEVCVRTIDPEYA